MLIYINLIISIIKHFKVFSIQKSMRKLVAKNNKSYLAEQGTIENTLLSEKRSLCKATHRYDSKLKVSVYKA